MSHTNGSKRVMFPYRKALGLWLAILSLGFGSAQVAEADWRPVGGHIMTRWAQDVSVDKVHPEYPRPMMVRQDWHNLNGLWEYAISPKEAKQPRQFDGEILVPFPAESALSGVKKPVGESNRLWYRHFFTVPKNWRGRRVLLHFEAVDWETTVWINDRYMGSHRGGYDPFSFDVTEALKRKGPQEIVLSVWDPINAGYQPRGKQVKKPGGIWYTSVTGIWQTVWLEPVPQTFIQSLKITPDIDQGEVCIEVEAAGLTAGHGLSAQVSAPGLAGSATVSGTNTMKIKMPNAKLWSPDSPYLYDLTVSITKDGRTVDGVNSYFGMRKISLGKDDNGINRLFLNNKPLFQYGPLDQGWWPDGLYTAPTDEALRYDIEVLKKLGCNMMRKHVKIEPRRFYYWCDKLGLMVWQDMPSGDRYIGRKDPDIQRSPESGLQFELELSQMIDTFRNHPSIVMWVAYNEGWGQYDTPRIVAWIKQYDPTRLVDNASGWTDRGVGDVHDIHSYPGPVAPPNEPDRAAVLGEFGGLGLPVKGHTWQGKKNWGYRSFKKPEELTAAYVNLIHRLRPLIEGGLSGAVYTQTTDVEIEINGLMTYDRAVIKMDAEQVAAANRKLYLPPPVIKTIVPTSQQTAQQWRYTSTKPAGNWYKTDYDDSSWGRGRAGFGREDTPGAILGTKWTSSDIWIRRMFILSDTSAGSVHLSIHHDEDAEVYINGQPVAQLSGYTSGYVLQELDERARQALRVGRNTIAVHCHQTTGGQYIDVGLVEVIER